MGNILFTVTPGARDKHNRWLNEPRLHQLIVKYFIRRPRKVKHIAFMNQFYETNMTVEENWQTARQTVRERTKFMLNNDLYSNVKTFVVRNNDGESESNASVNSSFAHPPRPGQLRGICTQCQSRGSGISQPKGYPQAFDTRVVSD